MLHGRHPFRTVNPGRPGLAVVIAGAYLLLAFGTVVPLVLDGYVGHGNGILVLVATAITSPLSALLFLLNDALFAWNAFYLTGWPYVVVLCELASGALLNAVLLYRFVRFVHAWRTRR